jgi:putative membrane protein (TIGR04086 family)
MGSERSIKIKALALGVLANIGGSQVLGIMLSLVMGIILGILGVSMNEMNAHIRAPILTLISGFGSAVLGGFVAGRIAKQKQVFHGALVGAIVSAIGILYGFLSSAFLPPGPGWYNIVLLVGFVPFGMVGGRIAENTCKKINDKSPNRSTITENKEMNQQFEIAPPWVAALLAFGAGIVVTPLFCASGMAGEVYGIIPVLEALGAISCCVASYLNRKYWFLLGVLFAFPFIAFSAILLLTEPEKDLEGIRILVTTSAILLASGIAGSLIGAIIRNSIRKRTNKDV